ncbi:hypothetical protein AXF19_11420 [Selenomonas sp. oral taxon 126]|nr:hypothetical protein AXF19_11420 [Selenomonas sp. oral taxon 126]
MEDLPTKSGQKRCAKMAVLNLSVLPIYARGAELLRDSEHGASHRGIEQMAVPSRKDVYLEAMEEAEDEDTESMQVGSTLCNSLQSRKLPERLLVDKQHGSGQDGDDKRKTDTLRLL